jgi:hypothetical protein
MRAAVQALRPCASARPSAQVAASERLENCSDQEGRIPTHCSWLLDGALEGLNAAHEGLMSVAISN